jgi:sugar/nucleoside kinase (ribokinase family)
MGKVAVSGYVSMDRMIRIDEPARVGYTSSVTNRNNDRLYVGGCSVNIAAALNRLGVEAVPLIRVGGDYKELGIPEFFREFGMSCQGISVVEHEITSRCYLIQDGQNQHITLFYEGAMKGEYAGTLPERHFENVSLGIMTVGSLRDNREFLDQCLRHGVPLAFGMKGDLKAFPAEFLGEVMAASRLIFVNEQEEQAIEEITGVSPADYLKRGSADAVITTRGQKGSICRYLQDGRRREAEVPAPAVRGEIDTTGAGDAYLAGFIYGYLNRMDWTRCCLAGTAVSYFVLQAPGCCTNLPDEAELKREMRRESEGSV